MRRKIPLAAIAPVAAFAVALSGCADQVTAPKAVTTTLAAARRAPLTRRPFRSVSAGYQFSCGVSMDGLVYCWGRNDVGQLGNGTTNWSTAPVQVPLGHARFASVSAGQFHACALSTGGAAYCWGLNEHGQLGDGGSEQTSLTPVRVTGGLSFVSLTTNENNHVCALTAAGTAYCWGANEDGELGDGSNADSGVPAAVVGGHVFTALTTGGHNNWEGDLSVSGDTPYGFTCGLTAGGNAWCWGENKTGNGAYYDPSNTPVPAGNGMHFRVLSAGEGTVCGVATDGAAYCWGDNNDGQVGDGAASPDAVLTPAAVATSETFVSITTSGHQSCGVTAAGAAWCWGRNGNGELGNGVAGDSQPEPVAVTGGISLASLEAGTFHTCGVSMSGQASCWGQGWAGQLGTGSQADAYAPAPVAPLPAPLH